MVFAHFHIGSDRNRYLWHKNRLQTFYTNVICFQHLYLTLFSLWVPFNIYTFEEYLLYSQGFVCIFHHSAPNIYTPLIFSLLFCKLFSFFFKTTKKLNMFHCPPFHSKYKSVLPAPPQGHTACQISQISCKEIISLLFVLLHKF